MITTWLAFIEALGVPSITCGNITIHIADGRPQKWEITQTGKIPVDSGANKASTTTTRS